MRRRRAPLLRSAPPILGSLLPSRLPEPAPLRTFYVDKANGNDLNSGATEIAPWASLQDYLSGTAGPSNSIVPTAGDLVIVKDYPGQVANGQSSVGYRPASGLDHVVSSKSGSASNPITVKAFPGHRPVILGQQVAPGVAISRCLRMTGNSGYWRWRGFNFPYSAGVGANEPTVYIASTAHHIELYDCLLHGATDGSGSVSDAGTHHVHYVNCRFYENDDWRGGTNQSHGLYIIGSDYMALNCLFYNQNNGYGCQIRAGAKRAIIANCVSAYNDGSVAEFAGYVIESDPSGTNDNLVVNCIAYHNRRGIHALAGTGYAGNRAHHDLAFAGLTSTFTNGTAGKGWDWSLDGSGLYTPPGANLSSDPKLVNPAAFDFALLAGSPCYQGADPNYCPGFDINGAVRRAATIGAYRAPEEVA